MGVLASGSGTNLQALMDADLGPGKIVCFISNRRSSGAFQRADAAGIPSWFIDHRTFDSREAFDAAIVKLLQEAQVEWVIFAGFMRIVTPVLLDTYPGKVVNIHPSLLPAFPGTHAQRQAVEAGVKLAGCTVHLVEKEVDAGPILAQAAVPVLPEDTEETLRLRILAEEHLLFPRVIKALAEGRLHRSNHIAWFTPPVTS